jgi:RNA polymerase sigma factor (sigma-70 family)
MATAEDLLHEAFIVAMNKYDTFRGTGSFEGWIRKIVINTALMHIRNKKTAYLDESFMQHVTDETDTDNFLETRDDAAYPSEFSDEELFRAINSLPEHHKTVFNMYVLDDFTHIEISRQLKISVGTSKSHLSRARKKIREYLYGKTSEGKARHKQKRFLLLFPVFKCGREQIDRLFRRQLGNYSLPVNSELAFIQTALENAPNFVPAAPAQSFFGSKTFYLCASGGAAVMILVFPLLRLMTKEQSGLPQTVDEKTIITIKDTVPTDTIFKPLPNSTVAETKDTAAPSQEPKVIIKEVIEYKTIVVRDTVKIER